MSIWTQIFNQYTDPTCVDKRNYPYTLKKLKARVESNGNFASVRESLEDLTLGQACGIRADGKAEALGDGQMGTALLQGYIPDIFSDTIIQYGNRISISRKDYPVIPQSSNSSFKHRFYWRHDSAGVYREGDRVQSSITKRATDEYFFCKLADSVVFPIEQVEDSIVGEVALSTAQSANKVTLLEDYLFFSELSYVSDSVLYPMFADKNFISYDSCSDETQEFAAISSKISEAYLRLTTRLEDPCNPADLRLYVSPTVYSTIWSDDAWRRWDVLGATPITVTGRLPNLYGMEVQIANIGYFNTANNWVPQPYDIYIVAKDAAAIRQRTDMRMQPRDDAESQMTGYIMSERIRPVVLNPLNMVRVSCDDNLPIQALENLTYMPRDLSKGNPSVMEMTTINV